MGAKNVPLLLLLSIGSIQCLPEISHPLAGHRFRGLAKISNPIQTHRGLTLRGGADAKRPSVMSQANNALSEVLPTTRGYLLAALFLTMLNLIGIPEELFLFEPTLTFKKGQIWRPFTSACFVGKADMGMASNLYFLVKFGQEMERADGAPQQLTFLLFQVLILSFIGSVLGFPSFARSIISATIYCCSRRQPMNPMEIQFGMRVQYWLLPYVNAVVDVLQAQSPAALVPHFVGIFAGHIYYFFMHVVPEMGGKRYITPPTFLTAKTQSRKVKPVKDEPKAEKSEKLKTPAKKKEPVPSKKKESVSTKKKGSVSRPTTKKSKKKKRSKSAK